MPIIRIENLSKWYRLGTTDQRSLFREWTRKFRGLPPQLFWALRDISLDIEEGEVVGILGHNGAGKSTLLKILSQITRPSSGRILLRGRIASLLEVGTGFHPELTGRENMYLNGALLGMRRREVSARFDEMVAFAQVEEFIDTPVKRYSTGMRVRLAFAVAAHLEPEILLVDEVLAVGDAAFQEKCIGKMGEVATSGRTVLFVSHSAAAVENLCNRCVVLDHGHLVFDGTQTEGLQHYADRYAAKLEGTLRDRHDRSGTGEVRAVNLEVRNFDGRPVKVIRSGEGVEIFIQYESSKGQDVPQLTCDLTLINAMGSPMITQSNAFSGDRLTNLPPSGTLVCRLDSVPLVEGTYRFHLILTALIRKRGPMDEIHHAAELAIIPSDFFGGGKGPGRLKGDGPFLVRGQWRFQENEAPAALSA